MRTQQLIDSHLRVREDQATHTDHFLRALLEFRAALKDNDITNLLLKRLVLDYAAAERELYDLNRLKNKFLGVAAHDLRNPLTAISGMSEMLLGQDLGPVSETQREFLANIHTLSREMLSLVDDLLDVSIIDSGRLDLKRRPGSLKRLVEQRIRIHVIAAGQKGMKIHSSGADIPEVSFDAGRMAQVVDNLISNAVKYGPPDSAIFVAFSAENGFATVSVCDEGPGISDEEQQQLFGDFQRLSAQPTGGEKSTGLGLAIARRIVTAHSGRIGVRSTPGHGAAFYFSLPTGDES